MDDARQAVPDHGHRRQLVDGDGAGELRVAGLFQRAGGELLLLDPAERVVGERGSGRVPGARGRWDDRVEVKWLGAKTDITTLVALLPFADDPFAAVQPRRRVESLAGT